VRYLLSRAGRVFAAFALLLALAIPAYAVEPGEMLADPALEARAREISSEIRCLVCQNQSIDESNATLAHDLRVLIRDRLTAGDTDEEVIDFLVARYGEFVLLRPRLQAGTLLLWGMPILLLVAGGIATYLGWRRRKRTATAEDRRLKPEEEAALARILRDEA